VIARRSTMRKARVALARRLAIIIHAMLRDGDGVRINLSPGNPRDRRQNPAPNERRPREGADDGADSVAGPTAGRLRLQPSRPAASLAHQAPNEHAENQGTQKRRHPEEPSSALDPLESSIRRVRPFLARKLAVPNESPLIVRINTNALSEVAWTRVIYPKP
jgi:hypothetical protein